MRVVWQTRHTLRTYKRSHSALSRSTWGLSTPLNRRASANSCYDFLHSVLSPLKLSNSCSSYDSSARLQLILSSETCCSAAAPSTGRTCPYNDRWPITAHVQWSRDSPETPWREMHAEEPENMSTGFIWMHGSEKIFRTCRLAVASDCTRLIGWLIYCKPRPFPVDNQPDRQTGRE